MRIIIANNFNDKLLVHFANFQLATTESAVVFQSWRISHSPHSHSFRSEVAQTSSLKYPIFLLKLTNGIFAPITELTKYKIGTIVPILSFEGRGSTNTSHLFKLHNPSADMSSLQFSFIKRTIFTNRYPVLPDLSIEPKCLSNSL